MIFSVVERGFDVHHRISGKHAFLDGFAQTLFDCGDELSGHRTADDCVHELELTVRRTRLELDEDVAVLSRAAGLFLVFAFRFRGLSDGLAVSDPGFLPADVKTELVLDALAHYVKLRFAETADEHVAGLHVLFDLERRVLVLIRP